ncbi:MAG: hypothetical protein JSW61_10390 [Candidatus Thorarchaeota archaeon]|nr:MAG: hypothetical protein JSW61_10390 [Candidatus Thorarchaeota archaeon]
MRTERILLLTIVLLVSAAPQNIVTAQTTSESNLVLDPIVVTARLIADGTTVLEIRALAKNVGNESIESINLRIDSLDAELVDASAEGMELDATLLVRDRFTEVTLNPQYPIGTNDTLPITVELLVGDLQSFQTEDFSSTLLGDFTYYTRPTSTLGNFTFIVSLPSTAILSQQSAVPVYPTSDFNWTDGTSLSFSWFTSELQPGQERVYIVKYQLELTSMTSSAFTVEILLFTLAGVALGSVLTIGVPKAIRRLRMIGPVRVAGITQEEEVLLDVIRRKGGSCAQKELYTEFDMSQSRVSLTLTNLEQRGLIRRIREGRVNMVYIVESSDSE